MGVLIALIYEGYSMVDSVIHEQVVQIYTLQLWCVPIVYSDTLYRCQAVCYNNGSNILNTIISDICTSQNQ